MIKLYVIFLYFMPKIDYGGGLESEKNDYVMFHPLRSTVIIALASATGAPRHRRRRRAGGSSGGQRPPEAVRQKTNQEKVD